MRYTIHPVADENIDSLLTDEVLAETDDAAEAKRLADAHSGHAFGSGILDTTTGQIDVGFGFGVPCPADESDPYPHFDPDRERFNCRQ